MANILRSNLQMTFALIDDAGLGVKTSLAWVACLVASFCLAFAPSVSSLIAGPWQTEQEGHGPLIIAGALWLAWQSRSKLKAIAWAPAPKTGALVLAPSLLLTFMARTQEVLAVEVLLRKEQARIAAGFSVLPAAVSTAAEAEADTRTTVAVSAIVRSRGIVPIAVPVVWPITTIAVMAVTVTIAVMSVTVAVVTTTRADVCRLLRYSSRSLYLHRIA
jgi:hypothetical protein